MKYIFVLCCLFVSNLSWAGNQHLPDIVLGKFIRANNKNALLECSLSNNKLCQEALGYAYLFGFSVGKEHVEKNIPEAQKWLSLSTSQPYSRYLLGELGIELSMDGTSDYNKNYLSLVNSACREGVVDACMRLSGIYSNTGNEYDKIIGNDATGNMKKAAMFNEKGIKFLERFVRNFKIHDQHDEIEHKFMLQNLNDYKKDLAIIKIAIGEKEGVVMLENLTLNDVDFEGTTLAKVYEEGEIVPQDLIKAYMYYDLSGGDEEEKARLDKKMTPGQIKEAVERSWNWQEQHHSYRPGYRSPWDYNF